MASNSLFEAYEGDLASLFQSVQGSLNVQIPTSPSIRASPWLCHHRSYSLMNIICLIEEKKSQLRKLDEELDEAEEIVRRPLELYSKGSHDLW